MNGPFTGHHRWHPNLSAANHFHFPRNKKSNLHIQINLDNPFSKWIFPNVTWTVESLTGKKKMGQYIKILFILDAYRTIGFSYLMHAACYGTPSGCPHFRIDCLRELANAHAHCAGNTLAPPGGCPIQNSSVLMIDWVSLWQIIVSLNDCGCHPLLNSRILIEYLFFSISSKMAISRGGAEFKSCPSFWKSVESTRRSLLLW